MRALKPALALGVRVLPGLAVVAFLSLSPARDASAHSMTFVSTSLQQACVASGSSAQTNVYTYQGPTNKTWSTRLQVFLANGDRYQDARFSAYLWDAATTDDVGVFQHAARDWINPGIAHFSQTMSAHIGGSFHLIVNLFNPDIYSQCFWVWGDGKYQ